MNISYSNINRNCKSIVKTDTVKELGQSPVASDDTVNFLHQQRLEFAKNLIIAVLK